MTTPDNTLMPDYDEGLHKIVMNFCAATMSMEECRNMEIQILTFFKICGEFDDILKAARAYAQSQSDQHTHEYKVVDKYGVQMCDCRELKPCQTDDHEKHPYYGECDALGPGGNCAECLKMSPLSGLREKVVRMGKSWAGAYKLDEGSYIRGFNAALDAVIALIDGKVGG